MGYVEKILGDNEQVVYKTHRHVIVLIGRIAGWLFAFLVFLAAGLVVLLPDVGTSGDKLRWFVGLIALCTLLMPAYLIISGWVRGKRGSEFLRHLWRPALAAALILAFALVLMFRPETRPAGWATIVVALIPAAEVIRVFLDWLNERYFITNRRVMQVKGVINKEISDSALEKVNDVKMTQSIVGRLLRYGTVEIITGSDIGVNLFHRISNPVRFKREMLNAKEQLHAPELGEGPARLPPKAPGGASASAAPSEASITDLLGELADLKQKGVISEEEFQAKKKELLARL
jgi:hypothetical protein